MRKPVFIVEQGHVLKRLAELQDQSVHCAASSLPFWLQRLYAGKDSYGFEATLELWAANQVKVFREVKRVLRNDGICWIVCGEGWFSQRSFAGPGKAAGGAFERRHKNAGGAVGKRLQKHHELKDGDITGQAHYLGEKLRADGWYWRSTVVLEFENPTPESVSNRPVQSHQYLLMLTKQQESKTKTNPDGYFWDKVSSREPGVAHDRLIRSVWTGPVGRSYECTINGKLWRHTSTMPLWIPKKCLQASIGEAGCCPQCFAQWVPVYTKGKGGSTGKSWHDHEDDLVIGNQKKTSSKDYVPPSIARWAPGCVCNHRETVPAIVLDPYTGSSTTGVEALTRGADFIGFDLDPRAIKVSKIRLAEHEKSLEVPLFDSRKAAREQAEMFKDAAS